MTSIALIGSGIFAREEHLPAIKATPSLKLVAIYSRSRKSADALAAEADGAEVYSEDQEGKTYDDLLKREDVKGVVIALPIPNQPAYIQKAVSAGKHVLAEKPLAQDVATAEALLARTSAHTATPGPTLSIAENFRFLATYAHAAAVVPALGRLLHFRTRVHICVQPGSKYYETAWRKTPAYQGGFLLDGGVHFVAATRLLLGAAGERVVRVAAFTALLQEHLPPVDTVDAVVGTGSGVSGTVSISFGMVARGSEYVVACEGGTVTVTHGKVVVTRAGQEGEEVKEFPEMGSGVKEEVGAWGEALGKGAVDRRQSAEEALKDLRVLEAMLKSGEQGGKVVEVEG